MPTPFLRLIALVLACAAAPALAQEAPLLAGIFQDHGVLQRDRPIALWGSAQPRERVRVTLAGNMVEVHADRAGTWRATLPALPAGGPHTLAVVSGTGTQTVSDVLIGDVWLCSGQSNMEYPVSRALNGGDAYAANDPQLRILTVQQDTATTPRAEFVKPVRWQLVTPQTIGDFSAACYFMARDLRQSEGVPMGLIDATWGGTAISAWTSEAALGRNPEMREGLALFALNRDDRTGAAQRWGATWGEWWRTRSGDAPGSEPWQTGATGQWKPVPSLSAWEGWGVPETASYNGVVWYSAEVDLTAGQAARPATLAFGVVDDVDMTWVNGHPVGATASWSDPRSYGIAPGVLRAGANRIVIAAYDSWGPGGLTQHATSHALTFDDGTSVALPEASGWRYRVTPGTGEPPRAPWETTSGLAIIYNGMIAPLRNYGLRGVAWYQGEADTGARADTYAVRLRGMIQDWRGQFGNEALPFLAVQLANWGPRNAAPVESGFATVRDQQRLALLGDANAALIVAYDLGEPTDIHPANKQDVGHRLARAARILTYGASGSASGPAPLRAVRGFDGVNIRFEGIDGRLVTYSSGQVAGLELCGAAPGSCRFMPGRVSDDGDAVLVDAGYEMPTRVRYCWGDSPVCNLYDGSGLPVSPFELAVE